MAAFALLAGLGLTVIAVQLSRRHLQAADRQRFEAAAVETERAFADGMTLYFLVLRSIHGLLSASHAVEPSESRTFYQALQADRHRGIRAMGFVGEDGEAYRVRHVEPSSNAEGQDLRTDLTLAARPWIPPGRPAWPPSPAWSASGSRSHGGPRSSSSRRSATGPPRGAGPSWSCRRPSSSPG